MMIVQAAAAALLGYVLGSTPFGLILAKVGYRVDIRDHGSGNIGATNVLRILGLLPSLGVLIADVLKGSLSVVAARYVFADAVSAAGGEVIALSAAFMVVVGHNFSVYLRFSGGKGVSTALGAILVLDGAIGLVLIAAWLLTLAASRYVSLASMAAAVVFPAAAVFRHLGEPYFIVYAFLTSGLVIVQHRANVSRLRRGTESRIFEVKPGGSRARS